MLQASATEQAVCQQGRGEGGKVCCNKTASNRNRQQCMQGSFRRGEWGDAAGLSQPGGRGCRPETVQAGQRGEKGGAKARWRPLYTSSKRPAQPKNEYILQECEGLTRAMWGWGNAPGTAQPGKLPTTEGGAAGVDALSINSVGRVAGRRRQMEKNERGKNAGQALRPWKNAERVLWHGYPGSMDGNENVEILGVRCPRGGGSNQTSPCSGAGGAELRDGMMHAVTKRAGGWAGAAGSSRAGSAAVRGLLSPRERQGSQGLRVRSVSAVRGTAERNSGSAMEQ